MAACPPLPAALCSPCKDTPPSPSLTWQPPHLQTMSLPGQPPLSPTTSQEAAVAPDAHGVSSSAPGPPSSVCPSPFLAWWSFSPELSPTPAAEPAPLQTLPLPALLPPAALPGPMCSPLAGTQCSSGHRHPCAQCWALADCQGLGKAGLEQGPSHLSPACPSVPRSLGFWAKGEVSWGLALPW